MRQCIEDRHDLSAGKVARLVHSVRKEIEALSAEPGWSNSWNDKGHIPDFSRVRERLGQLLAKGHANKVVMLGEKLLEAGKRQVEMTDDEVETAGEIAYCLDIVFQALPESSLSPVDQMLWAVEAELNDDYELCHGSEAFWEKEHPVAAWNAMAQKLMQLLNQ